MFHNGNDLHAYFPGTAAAWTAAPESPEATSSIFLQGGYRTQAEAVARRIHVKSPRAVGPFIITRCGLYRGTLLERRFFTQAAGGAKAYIRKTTRQPGHIESAHAGTLYVDQIHHATPRMQRELLRLITEGVFLDPLENKPLPADVRIIASSAFPLELCIRSGRLNPQLADHLHPINIIQPELETLACP